MSQSSSTYIIGARHGRNERCAGARITLAQTACRHRAVEDPRCDRAAQPSAEVRPPGTTAGGSVVPASARSGRGTLPVAFSGKGCRPQAERHRHRRARLWLRPWLTQPVVPAPRSVGIRRAVDHHRRRSRDRDVPAPVRAARRRRSRNARPSHSGRRRRRHFSRSSNIRF